MCRKSEEREDVAEAKVGNCLGISGLRPIGAAVLPTAGVSDVPQKLDSSGIKGIYSDVQSPNPWT